MAASQAKDKMIIVEEDFDIETEEGDEDWDNWNEDEGEGAIDFQCLFCNTYYNCRNQLFEHCISKHQFDFRSIRKALNLHFYGCFKLINYVRQTVAENRCWSCGLHCKSNQELLYHLHRPEYTTVDLKSLWDDEKYLRPFVQGDPLLFNFDESEEDNDEEIKCVTTSDVEELMTNLNCPSTYIENVDEALYSANLYGKHEVATSHGSESASSNDAIVNGADAKNHDYLGREQSKKSTRLAFGNISSSDIRKVNESYFGSYSSFSIHREMLGDKARTDAYRQAIVNNTSLLDNAVVMDLGCGTGILSLFAAQAGASSVIAVEASEKMAAVATQIAKDNGYCDGVITVVNGMVEDLQFQPRSIDVLVSEWMGYCLLYESMLSSVLFARDKWLKPGGAILPDTATMFAAGFGRGGTSLPFWENVYGFNMSTVGREVVQDSANLPIVDVIDSCDLVTTTAALQNFDIVTMTVDDMDFTASIELQPKDDPAERVTWCHGIVLWFETGFTSRFCKEMPTVLSTSPYMPKTHWSQTILTLKEPIALLQEQTKTDGSATVGTESCPAAKIQLRVSIARAVQHRAIDISLEPAAVLNDGRKSNWPVQIFTLV